MPDDVAEATAWVVGVAVDVDAELWDLVPVTGDWTPRRTLDHLVDVMLLYAGCVVTRAVGRIVAPRNGDASASPNELVDALMSTSQILVRVLDSMANDERAFHPSGSADRTGWVGMACTELLVHGYDIAVATRREPTARRGPNGLAEAVVERVLPWAPTDADAWSRLLWATGRTPLSGRAASGADWWWHSAPLDEWDGLPRHRDAPPRW